MNKTLSLFLAEVSLRKVIAVLALPPLLASAFQPFSTIDLTYTQRLVFWVGVLALALCVTWAARHVGRTFFAGVHFSWQDTALVLVNLALFVPSLWVLSYLFITINGQQAPGLLSVVPYGALFVTGLLLVRGHKPTDTLQEDSAPALPRLVKRLPKTFQGQIYRLTVRDHAVDVVTSEGTFTIRSRFTDAIADMDPVPGHCTHRSHWVVDNAIVGVEREDGKTFVRLANGDLVPVSRKYKPMLEQDGVM
jgi:hypothetical protein